MRALGSLGRTARVGVLVAVSSVAASAIVACVDLFHSTEFDTLCVLDATAAECRRTDAAAGDAALPAVDAAPPPPTDFCKWSPEEARGHAEHACAWIGACAGPFGKNQLGACMIDALLAYDCSIDPQRPVRGEAHAYWDRLWKATTCEAAVGAIVSDLGAVQCPIVDQAYAQCASAADGGGGDPSTRVACAQSSSAHAPSALESCAKNGQRCARPGDGVCAGPSGICTAKGTLCVDGGLVDCDGVGAIDNGMDCRDFGDQACAPDAAACLPLPSGTPCVVDGGLRCGTGNVVSSCPAGRMETVDCRALLGDAGACVADAGGRAWDVTRGCTAGACTVDDYCEGGAVKSCARGVTFTVDCASLSLGRCVLETLPAEKTRKAHCARPDAGL